MSDNQTDSCQKGISFKCMHSREAIEMLLSHAPLRYSIKEISGLTDFHRNTIRPTVKELVDEGKISTFGSTYYNKTVSDHYRTIAKSLYGALNMGLSEQEKLKIMRSFGHQLVTNNLQDILDIEYSQNFDHDNLIEALLHLKMSYPFSDIAIVTEQKETRSGNFKEIEVVRPTITFDVNADAYESKSEFELKINPCLCDGDPNLPFACEMVAGALEGGMKTACGAEPHEVTHLKQDIDETGSYCSFYINATLSENIDPEIMIAEELDLV